MLCSDVPNQPNISEYEVCTTEPLHDLKNVINRIMDELPYLATEVPELHIVINDTLTILQGTVVFIIKT